MNKQLIVIWMMGLIICLIVLSSSTFSTSVFSYPGDYRADEPNPLEPSEYHKGKDIPVYQQIILYPVSLVIVYGAIYLVFFRKRKSNKK